MKKRLMADVLWNAANKHLTTSETATFNEWSCNAALNAEWGSLPYGTIVDSARKASATDAFLKSLGCKTGGHVGGFGKYKRGSDRQGVRYLWLLLAAQVAEDEGLTC